MLPNEPSKPLNIISLPASALSIHLSRFVYGTGSYLRPSSPSTFSDLLASTPTCQLMHNCMALMINRRIPSLPPAYVSSFITSRLSVNLGTLMQSKDTTSAPASVITVVTESGTFHPELNVLHKPSGGCPTIPSPFQLQLQATTSEPPSKTSSKLSEVSDPNNFHT